MKEKPIKPTNKQEEYVLEDKDFLLIEAIRNLTQEIKRLNVNLGKR